MSKIRGKHTKPEILVRKFLYGKGFRYRLHVNSLPGKPDIVMSSVKIIVNIDGCFWHGHIGCKYFKVPQSRTEWWLRKINATKQRDIINAERLKRTGWTVITLWECELKKQALVTLNGLLRKINLRLHSQGSPLHQKEQKKVLL